MITRTSKGNAFGPFFWRYDLHTAADFVENTPYRLRWYGVNLTRTLALGFIVRVRAVTTPAPASGEPST